MSTPVIDNLEAQRFEVDIEGHRALLAYRRVGRRLVLIHTEVPAELEGQGIGGALVEAALEEARTKGLTVVPRCPFARQWLQRHREAAAGVEIDWPPGDET